MADRLQCSFCGAVTTAQHLAGWDCAILIPLDTRALRRPLHFRRWILCASCAADADIQTSSIRGDNEEDVWLMRK